LPLAIFFSIGTISPPLPGDGHEHKQSTAEELKEILTPFHTEVNLTPQEEASIKEWTSSQPDDVKSMNTLMEEAKGPDDVWRR